MLPTLLVALTACKPDAGLTVYNTAPEVDLASPIDGETFHEAEAVSFSAFVADGQSSLDELTLTWASTAQGTLQGTQTVTDAGVVFVPTTSTPATTPCGSG